MKVSKFGGSSLANGAQMRRVRAIIESDPDRRIVVVSAPGKREDGDVKVTDLLIACGEAALDGRDCSANVEAVADRFIDIALDLDLDSTVVKEIKDSLVDRLNMPKVNPHRFMDAVKAAGEDFCAQLMAAYLNATGMPAKYVNPEAAGLLLSEEYGKARILDVSYKNLASLRDAEEIVVFPGYFGYTPSGHLVTFSRGGSDITGAILAAAVDADLYENWSDVDGILVADPKVVTRPRVIKEITYRELRELAYAGFHVFHDEAMAPVVRTGTPVNLRNTNNPSAPGTLVVPARESRRGSVIGIARNTGFACIQVTKYLMNREKGFGRRLLQIIEEADCSFEHSPTGVDSMSVVMDASPLGGGVLESIVDRIKRELDVDTVDVENGLALISVVGEGMAYIPGVCARAAAALAHAGVNIELINQGPAEISMVFGVKEADGPAAIRALYREFFAQ